MSSIEESLRPLTLRIERKFVHTRRVPQHRTTNIYESLSQCGGDGMDKTNHPSNRLAAAAAAVVFVNG